MILCNSGLNFNPVTYGTIAKGVAVAAEQLVLVRHELPAAELPDEGVELGLVAPRAVHLDRLGAANAVEALELGRWERRTAALQAARSDRLKNMCCLSPFQWLEFILWSQKGKTMLARFLHAPKNGRPSDRFLRRPAIHAVACYN